MDLRRWRTIEQLLLIFSRDLGATGQWQGSPVAAPSSYPGVVQRGLRYIAEHLDESLTLTQLAGRLHVSRFYLCRLFRRHTGHTLSELVSRARLQRACELLADPALRVTEAAFAAGFGSIPHFNAVFKRHLGVAPTRYRQALRPG